MTEPSREKARHRGFSPYPDGMLPLTRGEMDLSAIPPEFHSLLPQVPKAAEEPFVGITTDGHVIPDLYALRDTGWNPEPAAKAASAFLDSLTFQQRKAVRFEVDATEWRIWINAALGELIDQYRDTLTEYGYFFALFGTPSATEPWGWQLWGHYLDVHCFVLGRQLVLTPQRNAGLELRRSLRPEQERLAVLYASMRAQDLPTDLAGLADGRHLGGAGQDNRIIPYEGLRAEGLTLPQRDLLLNLVSTYVDRLPSGPADALLTDVERHLDDTHLAWIGGAGDDDPFYYRIHSPVVLIEYDCHQGIFLDNPYPEPFHVHTIVRTPNGGDYGRDLLHRRLASHHAGARSADPVDPRPSPDVRHLPRRDLG